LCIYHIFFTHSPIDGQVDWFYSLAILNSAVLAMCVQVSLLYANLHSWVYAQECYTRIISPRRSHCNKMSSLCLASV
jgi:hypothetical protein